MKEIHIILSLIHIWDEPREYEQVRRKDGDIKGRIEPENSWKQLNNQQESVRGNNGGRTKDYKGWRKMESDGTRSTEYQDWNKY